MIRKGTLADINPIITLCRACAQKMKDAGIFQWNEHYPNSASFIKDVERGELYVLELRDQLIGTIVISIFMDNEYSPVEWLTEHENNIYIHRLAIDPNHQGQGFAQQLMDFAENYARKNNYCSLRLDTFSQNKRNQKFYEQRGYQKLGSIYFPKQSAFPFYCYELVL